MVASRLAAVGPRVSLGIQRLRARLGHEPRQLSRGIAAPNDQPAAAGAEVGIQAAQAAEQEGQAFLADIGGCEQRGVQHEDGHDTALCASAARSASLSFSRRSRRTHQMAVVIVASHSAAEDPSAVQSERRQAA